MLALSQLIHQYGPEAVIFLLIFGRTVGLIFGAPFWGSRAVPFAVRTWVAVLLAVATYPLVRGAPLADGISLWSLFIALGGEIFLGLMLGWLAQLLFAAFRVAAQEIEIKSGLGLIHLVDPHEGGQSGVFAVFFEVTAGLIFFSLNGHHLLLQALSSSFQVFPLGGEKFLARGAAAVASSAGEIFGIALRVAAPVLVGLLLTDIVLGIMSRAIPQMNVFMVAQPMQFGFGLVLLLLSLPAFVWLIGRYLPLLSQLPGATP